MNKKLFALLVVGTLPACGQADSGAQASHRKTVQKTKTQIAEMKKTEMKVTHVDAIKALSLMKSRPELVVLDVRTPAEFASGHINGAINIDFKNSNFATKIAKLDGSQEYLIHCRSGKRSTRSLTTFRTEGFSHIIHMDGGIIGWNKAGLPTIK